MFSVRDFYYRAMALRKLCKDTKKRPLKALFFFPDENLTGIAPTRLIVEKDNNLTEGMKVYLFIILPHTMNYKQNKNDNK